MRSLTPATILVCLLFCSCKKQGIVQHFREPKNTPAQTPTSNDASKQPYAWSLPEGWIAKPASGMRLATIVMPTNTGTLLEASITELGGSIPGNVNRWREQVGLARLPDEQITASMETIRTGFGNGYIVSLNSPDNTSKSILAAIIPRTSDQSIFVKATGPQASLESISAPFRQFITTLSP